MALTDKLSAIGTAIREKTGGTELLTLDAMPTEIRSISGAAEPVIEELSITANGTYTAPEGTDGYSPVVVNVPQDGSPPESAFVITGDCKYKFAHNGWTWFIEQYGNQITTRDITDCSNMFEEYSLKKIPFEINLSGSSVSINNMFLSSDIETVPYINGNIQNAQGLFRSCTYLNSIPEDWAEHITWDKFNSYNYSMRSNFFANCFSLRHIPDSLMSVLYGTAGNSSTTVLHYGQFSACYSLDEINNIVPQQATLTAGRFIDSFNSCHRLKNATFALQDDGTPYTVSWKSQVIDLSINVGYATNTNVILNYNSGITSDKQVTDDTIYQALKDDPDWFTCNIAYSRYNHDSAVATINSLPDTSAYLASAGGTNTIKFKGAAGSATDGGAINTLTEEEIAVATAKGWTVTLV